jgi:hypothetical protein
MKRSTTPSCTDRVKGMLTMLGTLLLAICAGLVEARRLLGPLEDPQGGSRLLKDDRCPGPESELTCAGQAYAPVKCELMCEYRNRCESRASGFTDTQCPFVPFSNPELENLNPVLFGQQNLTPAVFVFPRFSPTAAPSTVPAPPTPTSCPEPNNPAATCPYDPNNPPSAYEEVQCGACTYPTACFALAAGFDLERDCGVVLGDDVISVQCPVFVQPTPTCVNVTNEPVRCGPDLCYYENTCLADFNGFNASECEVVAPPTPSRSPVRPCPRPLVSPECQGVDDVVYCGPDGCPFPNLCQAGVAGYSSTDCTRVPR